MGAPAQNGVAWRRFRLLRILRGRWRLFACAALGVGLALLAPESQRATTRALLGWNAGLWIYLLTALFFVGAKADTIRRRAILQDEGRYFILFFASLAAIASLVAIVMEMGEGKNLQGLSKTLHVGLAISTITSSWIFVHLMFAIHYAHEYFIERDQDKLLPPEKRGGIQFPGGEMPDFWDFLYFSFIIGVAAQTADVAITSKGVRRISLLHSIISFVFNTAIVALTINIASSLVAG